MAQTTTTGASDFQPIWAELNRCKAIVFIYPTHPVDTNLIHNSLTQPMFDSLHDTGWMATEFIVNDTYRTYLDYKIILLQTGGTLPFLIYPPAGPLPHLPMSIGKSTEDIVEEARRFHFATALSSNLISLRTLLTLAKPGHLLFGADFLNTLTLSLEHFTKNPAGFDIRRHTMQEH